MTTMVKLQPQQSLSMISFDCFEPVKLDVILHLSSLYPQLKLHMQPFYLKLSIPVRNEDSPTQTSRKPITLNKYMPKYMPREFWRVENVLVSCYHFNEEKNLIEPIMKESHDASSDLSHGVYTTKISFNDED
ncbi:hypothetical protein SADUNF_Sadunf13G0065700 [Salix dunnii]|uniref:Uncharacterized protein n=1 Tax=Salix dunnii TaxID=1413687 RepID=A0A835JKS4_9ROSI|nr:hypothetical protein SADUNF_Sadunf13G0065400 [Salix dunnii]KAF9670413.1 hypothetical protein SADUNF_Sadunf13G0065700 [Salix dunnii]